MQSGTIVILEHTKNCPQTNTGQHQVENVCRMCGGEAGLKELADMVERQCDEISRLTVALHDTICRPMGVVPESAEGFYDPKLIRKVT